MVYTGIQKRIMEEYARKWNKQLFLLGVWASAASIWKGL